MPVVLPPLERLSELIERVVVLLDQAPAPVPAPLPPAAPEPPAVEARREEPRADVDGHVLFVSAPAGYRLLEREGRPPGRGELVELAQGRQLVVRVGPSPLPGDRRRCAFLEQEPPEQNRSPTGERGEPDRRDEGGPQG